MGSQNDGKVYSVYATHITGQIGYNPVCYISRSINNRADLWGRRGG